MMIKAAEPQAAADAALAAEPEPDSPAHDSLMLDEATLSLDIDCRHEAWQGLEAMLAAQADFVWRHLDLPPAEISLVLADSTFIATLNETYRDKKGATNVLSFPAQDFTAPVKAAALNNMPLPRLLGDIVLAHDVLAEEAQAQGKDKQDHMCHLLTHGCCIYWAMTMCKRAMRRAWRNWKKIFWPHKGALTLMPLTLTTLTLMKRRLTDERQRVTWRLLGRAQATHVRRAGSQFARKPGRCAGRSAKRAR